MRDFITFLDKLHCNVHELHIDSYFNLFGVYVSSKLSDSECLLPCVNMPADRTDHASSCVLEQRMEILERELKDLMEKYRGCNCCFLLSDVLSVLPFAVFIFLVLVFLILWRTLTMPRVLSPELSFFSVFFLGFSLRFLAFVFINFFMIFLHHVPR